MRVAIANDHRGVNLKFKIIKILEKWGYEVINIGSDKKESVDYPDFGSEAAKMVSSGKADMGIAICGSGIGMSIITNKFPNVRAALAYNPEIARMTRKHNNANILVLAADYINEEKLEKTLKNFFETSFDGGRHQRRIDKISNIENKLIK